LAEKVLKVSHHDGVPHAYMHGKALLPYQNNAEYLAREKKWQVQCVALLERAFGKDNAYVKEFQGVQNYGNRDFHIIDGSAIMEGAKEDLDYSYKSEKLEKNQKKSPRRESRSREKSCCS